MFALLVLENGVGQMIGGFEQYILVVQGLRARSSSKTTGPGTHNDYVEVG
jgi:hypothetical protein